MYQWNMNVITASKNSYDIVSTTEDILSALNVSDFVTSITPSVGKKKNERQILLNELYQLYLDACNKEYYWKNKKRCYAYLRLHHPKAFTNKESYTNGKELFRKANLPQHQKYLTPYKEDEHMWYKRFNTKKKQEIREIISNAKDIKNRKGNVIAYILHEEDLSTTPSS